MVRLYLVDKYGNAIRVSRSDGSGNWPLEYDGRQIVYYKGVTYTFRFKYRVINGNGVPFKIGWWVDEGEGPNNDLDYRIKDLGDSQKGGNFSKRGEPEDFKEKND